MDTLRRRSIRLMDYDYTQDGAYFLTVCAYKRECMLGAIVGDEMVMNEFGNIVRDEWLKTATIRAEVELDEYVVMPNHFHAVLFIAGNTAQMIGEKSLNADNVGARRAVPLQPECERRQFGRPIARSLPTIVGAFKSAATKRINEARNTPGAPVWQRNYYESVIRNESALKDIRLYIQTNPACWAQDAENPANALLEMRSYT
jgi:REP element-mobilizing transposase RayT